MRVDPQNCLKQPEKCTGDYGIGQINGRVWKEALNLDTKKLKTDPKYAIMMTAKILANYKKRYGNKELNWYTRYHSGTPSKRADYQARLNKAFEKINDFLDSQRYVASMSQK